MDETQKKEKKKKRFLKTVVIVLAVILFFQLARAWVRPLLMPRSAWVPPIVRAGGNLYRPGFYLDELFPVNLEYLDEEYEIRGITFHRVTFSGFDCLHASIGDTANGELYCLNSQWKQAQEYYASLENFSYYCEISPDQASGTERADIHRIDDMDPEQFDALFNSIHGTEYDPFDMVSRLWGTRQEAEPIYMPSSDFYYLTFYRQSNDCIFTTAKGNKFVILDGVMYFIRYYSGDGYLHVIEIPEETADYFIDLVYSLDSPYL